MRRPGRSEKVLPANTSRAFKTGQGAHSFPANISVMMRCDGTQSKESEGNRKKGALENAPAPLRH